MFRTRLSALKNWAYGIAFLLPICTAVAAAHSGGGGGHGGGGHSGGGHAMSHGHSSGFHSGGFHSGHGNRFNHNRFGRGFRNRGFSPFFGFGGDFFPYWGWDYDAYDWPSYGYTSPTITNVQDYAYGYASASDGGSRYGPMPRYADVSPRYADISSTRLTIAAPKDAEVWVEQTKIASGSSIREFSTPPLEPGRQYRYTIRAKWVGADGQTITQAQDVMFSAGNGVIVRFPLPAEQQARISAGN